MDKKSDRFSKPVRFNCLKKIIGLIVTRVGITLRQNPEVSV
jgi:hypothetical protein